MGILRLLRSTLEALCDIAMILKEYRDDCKENTEEKSPYNGFGNVVVSSNSDQNTQEGGDRLSEHVSDTTSVENASKNEAGACSMVSLDKPVHGEVRQCEFVSQNLGVQVFQRVNEESTSSTSLQAAKRKLGAFRTQHYVYCYSQVVQAFCMLSNDVYATPILSNLIPNLVGNDPKKIGLCFFILKVSLLGSYCALHGSDEMAKAVVLDQKLLKNPAIINNLLKKVLSFLYSNDLDICKQVSCGYNLLHNKVYVQKFAGPVEDYEYQFYVDVLCLLCQLCEYQVVTGHNENSDLVDQMLLGCIMLLGGMYFKMYGTCTKNRHAFKDRIIGDKNIAERCNDIGKKCYDILKMLLTVYSNKRKKEGYKCGVVDIPYEVAVQCSDNLFSMVKNCYSNDVPYSVFVKDIVSGIVKLVDKYSIGLLSADVSRYKQRYDNKSLIQYLILGVYKFSIFDESVKQQKNVAVSDISTTQEPIQSDEESSTVSVQISEEGTGAHGRAAGGVDYEKLGAKPKDKRASKSSKRSTSRRQSMPVSTDDTKDSVCTEEVSVSRRRSVPVNTDDTKNSVCTEEVEEHIGYGPATVKLVHENILMFKHKLSQFGYEHTYYLSLMVKKMFVVRGTKLGLNARCKGIVSRVTNGDPEVEKLCEDVLKIAILSFYNFVYFNDTSFVTFYVMNGSCIINFDRCVNDVLCDIVDIMNTKQNLGVARCNIMLSLVRHNLPLFKFNTVLHDPKFYSSIMRLLCRLYEYQNDTDHDTRKFPKMVCELLMLKCIIIMGSMYVIVSKQILTDKENNPLSYKLYTVMQACMHMYSTSRKGKGSVNNVLKKLSTVCSADFLCCVKKEYTNGKIPFELVVADMVSMVGSVITSDNVGVIFNDISKYEHIYNQDRQTEDRFQGGDGSNDNFPYKPAGNSGHGL